MALDIPDGNPHEESVEREARVTNALIKKLVERGVLLPQPSAHEATSKSENNAPHREASQADTTTLPTVAEFANELHVPSQVVLEQLRAAGVEKRGPEDLFSHQDMTVLLAYLRGAHGRGDANALAFAAWSTREIPSNQHTHRVRGWVYVISNNAMPGLVKIGYSTQDPELRAKELNHTGSPHPYLVDYDLLVDDPREVEQQAHKVLADVREGREWFKCTAEDAIVAIKESVGDRAAYIENFRRAKREAAKSIAEERARQRDLRQKAEDEIATLQTALRTKVDQLMLRDYPKAQFFPYWLGWAIVAAILFVSSSMRITELGIAIASTIVGVVGAVVHTGIVNERRHRSASYQENIRKLNAALADIRSSVEKKYGLNNPMP